MTSHSSTTASSLSAISRGPSTGAGVRSVWVLPTFLTKKNKWPAGILMFLVAGVLYLTSNHIHLFPPRLLPMSPLDQAIPFMPWTVWIYTSEYLFFAAVYLTCRDLVNLNKYLYSFIVLQSVSVAIFWLSPTTYPRDAFPLTNDIPWLTYELFKNLRVTDSPANCCPSLHVSSVYLSAFIFLDDQPKKFPFFFTWGTLIALSTLTTKQHYIVDVIAGLTLSVITYWIFHRYVSYRPLRELRAERRARRT